MSLLDDVSLLVTPNAEKATKLYSIIPTNGNGDFTVTRATTATRTNASGLIESTPINEPRLDYSLGSCPNILLEPQRTNLALRSEEFNDAAWGKTNSSVTANSTASPSGIVNADTLTADGVSSQHFISQTNSFTLGVSYTLSVYLKKGTNNFAQLFVFNNIGGMYANFNLDNGVVGTLGTSSGSNPTSSITSVGNGWYRCAITFVPTITSVSSFGIMPVTSASAPRGESNTLSTSIFLWGAQLEAGAYATSYIPTTSASVTRNSDVISRDNIFTNGLITASGGTWFVDMRNNRILTFSSEDVGAGLELGNSSGASTNAWKFRRGGGTQRVNIWKVESGTSTGLYGMLTDNSKVAIKWNGTTADVFVNGVKVVSATSFTATNMEFLRYIQNQFPTYINSMALFPTPLTDTQCIALTT